LVKSGIFLSDYPSHDQENSHFGQDVTTELEATAELVVIIVPAKSPRLASLRFM